jgi:hypothetical protein
MVNWPKYVIKVKIKIKTYIVMLKCNLILPYFSIYNAHLMYNAHPYFFDLTFDV